MNRLKKMRAIRPYNSNGTTNLTALRGMSGVYIIYGPDNEIKYIGYSGTNLYKTITRHFQSWEDKTQVRVTYGQNKGHTVRVIVCAPARAEKLERALIVKHKPKDNPDKLKRYIPTKYEEDILSEYEQAPAVKYEDIDLPF